MTRHRRDIDRMLSEMRRWMRAWPDGRPVIGVVEITPWQGDTPGTVNVHAGGADFGPVHWVALADTCLEWAAKKLAATPGDNRENLMMIERARAALDFVELTRQ